MRSASYSGLIYYLTEAHVFEMARQAQFAKQPNNNRKMIHVHTPFTACLFVFGQSLALTCGRMSKIRHFFDFAEIFIKTRNI